MNAFSPGVCQLSEYRKLSVADNTRKSFFCTFLEGWKIVPCSGQLLGRQVSCEMAKAAFTISIHKTFKELVWSPASFPILTENNYCQRKLNLPCWNPEKLQSWLITNYNFCMWGDLFLDRRSYQYDLYQHYHCWKGHQKVLRLIKQKAYQQCGNSISVTVNYTVFFKFK